MHSNIYVFRPLLDWDGKPVVLPPMEDRTCVTEEDLIDSFVPNHGDYLSLTLREQIPDEINWLVEVCKYLSYSVSGDQHIITLKLSDAKEKLKKMFERFQDLVDSITLDDFSKAYSSKMLDLQESISNERGFWAIDIEQNGGWSYKTIDDWLRYWVTYCNRLSLSSVSFRVEDVFDYHN